MRSAPNRRPARWTPPRTCRMRTSNRCSRRCVCNARGGQPRRGVGAFARPGAVAPVPQASEVRPGDQNRKGPAAGAGGVPGGCSLTGWAGLRRGQESAAEAQEHLQSARTRADVGNPFRPRRQLEERTSTGCWLSRGSTNPQVGEMRRWTEHARRAGLAEGDPELADPGLCRPDESFVPPRIMAETTRPASTTCRMNWSFRNRRCPT